jgi:sulfhydrogenase subunit beta (sulfur reductase)
MLLVEINMYSENINNLNQMKKYFFDQETSKRFLRYLLKKGIVFAPHKKGEKSYSYEKLEDVNKVVYNYPRTIQPLKKFFLPAQETLLNFNLSNNTYTDPAFEKEMRIFFAIHSYEMQSILRLDYSFKKGNPESNYLDRRNNSCFIGISFDPDPWHFSKSVGIEIEKMEGFCLFFEPVENGHLVFEVNETGREMLAEFGAGSLVETPLDFEITDKQFKTKITYHFNRLPQIFEHVYNSKVWDEVAEKCVGCGTCNLLCPTCYCFDVRDEIDLNMTDGKRERFWDGCMLNNFSEVAGGENFRGQLSGRTRHRLYRKFKYITDESGELHCIGCGRCSKYCPADINIVNIINDLIIDYTVQQQKQVI